MGNSGNIITDKNPESLTNSFLEHLLIIKK